MLPAGKLKKNLAFRQRNRRVAIESKKNRTGEGAVF